MSDHPVTLDPNRTSSLRTTPPLMVAVAAGLLAGFSVLREVQIGTQWGLAAGPLQDDGSRYVLLARSKLRQIRPDASEIEIDRFAELSRKASASRRTERADPGTPPQPSAGQVAQHASQGASLKGAIRLLVTGYAPLWEDLLALHMAALGDDPAKLLTVRIWPVAILLLIVGSVVGRRAGPLPTLSAMAITAMLPVASPSLAAAAAEGSGTPPGHYIWYLADLRPDFLFSVLLAASLVVLADRTGPVTSRQFLSAGLIAGLAVMTKPNALPVAITAGGATVIWLIATAGPGRRVGTLRRSLWILPTFGIVILPWMSAGGLGQVVGLLRSGLTAYRAIYSNSDATVWSELTAYPALMPTYFGVAGTTIAVGGTVLVIASGFLISERGPAFSSSRPAAILPAVVMVWLMASLTPSKNLFVGAYFAVPMLVAGWMAVACLPAWLVRAGGGSSTGGLSSGVLSTGWGWTAASALAIGIAAVGALVSSEMGAARHAGSSGARIRAELMTEARMVIADLTTDLRRFIGAGDRFLSSYGWGLPTCAAAGAVDGRGGHPWDVPPDPAMTGDAWVRSVVADCRAAVVWRDDMNVVAPLIWHPPALHSHFSAMRTAVRSPGSGFEQVGGYDVPCPGAGQEGIRLRLELWVRTPKSVGRAELRAAPGPRDDAGR